MKNLAIVALLINFAFSFNFNLKPIKLSENSYYFYGKEDYFSKLNGGDISNSAFIITDSSVILIDSGSSVKYGEAVKEVIKKITDKPIKHIINTHHHPDHFLGNGAFKDAHIYATEFTLNEIKTNGHFYITNMENLLGDIVEDTTLNAPKVTLKEEILTIDGYPLNMLYLDGHTKSDLVVYDKNTNILYSSDIVFNNRALATPHADLDKWISSLEKLKKLDYTTCVPGHGVAFSDKKPLERNISYLQTIQKNLRYGVENGLDTFEILELEVPEDIKNFSIFEQEYERSIINLYNKFYK